MIQSPFNKMRKRISRTIHTAGVFISSVGATPAKQLRVAILEGDEQKAIDLYCGDHGSGKSLFDDVQPSQPFQGNKYGDQTPLHLAALMALDTLLMLFLEHGGNPEEANGHEQTALHCVCMRNDFVDKRLMILNNLLGWRSDDPLFGEMKVSVNHVDEDGNIALHYAARNGLLGCVVQLLKRNSIISLVNKGQKTCCDEADEANHTSMADMLEAALVFQPAEDDFGGLDLLAEAGTNASNQPTGLMLDSMSMSTSELYDWAQRSISLFVEVTNLPVGRVLAVLGGYDWDVSRALQEYIMNPESALKSAHLSTPEPATATGTAGSPFVDTIEHSPNRQILFDAEDSLDDALDIDGITLEDKKLDVAVHQALLAPSDSISGSREEKEVNICPICCDELLPAVSAAEAANELNAAGSMDEILRRALACHAGHSFCLQCWASHSSVQILENGAGVLQCPGYKCRECVEDAWAPVLFPATTTDRLIVTSTGTTTNSNSSQRTLDVLKKLKENKVRRIVDRHESLMWCPIVDCGCVVIIPKKNCESGETLTKNKRIKNELPSSAICGRGHAFCTACNEAAHSPCSCTEWMKWQLKIQTAKESAGGASDGSDLANALWVAANTKRCPKCKLPIEKDEGCNHMTCRKCRYEFCWVCMQDWGLHSQNTGGYFQCNRYVEQENAIGDDDDDQYVTRMFGDVGSSRREDMLIRRAGQRMERFLHHYTRFRSHDESFAMESKMHMDTLERLCRILMSSLDQSNEHSDSPTSRSAVAKFERLPWLQETVENPFSQKRHHADEFSVTTNSVRDDNDRLLIEELRLLRAHQKEVLEQKGAEESAKKSSVESRSWLKFVRESLYSKGSETEPEDKKMPTASEIDKKVSVASDEAAQIVPTILLFAAKGDILETNTTDFNESFGLGDSRDSNTMINRLRGLDFLQSGFRELLKCRQVMKSSFAFAFLYFSGDDADGSSNYGREMARQTRKLLFEQGQADLNARTETLSDVVARHRLRASRAIIDQATRSAHMARLVFERTLYTCASEIENIDEQRGASRARKSSGAENLRQRRSAHRPTSLVDFGVDGVAAPTVERRSRNRGTSNVPIARPTLPLSNEGTDGEPIREIDDFSSDHLDRQLRLILQSLEAGSSAGLLTRASDRDSTRRQDNPQLVPSSPTRGSMGPTWSPQRSTSLQSEPNVPTRIPHSSHSPPRKKAATGLLSHPDRGFIEALQRDGLNEDQIRAILGIADENENDSFVTRSPAVLNVTPVAAAPVNSIELDSNDEDEAEEDDEADINMAIMLSIQDPRLNDMTLRRGQGSGTQSQPQESAASNEDNINALLSMGFSRPEAQQALLRSSNDLEVAIHTLLRND